MSEGVRDCKKFGNHCPRATTKAMVANQNSILTVRNRELSRTQIIREDPSSGGQPYREKGREGKGGARREEEEPEGKRRSQKGRGGEETIRTKKIHSCI